MYIPDILYQSSLVGYLGCFHILAAVNDAVMDIGVHVASAVSDTLQL